MAVAELSRPEFEAVLNAVPANYLLLDPEFTILSATDAWLSATRTVRADIVGRRVFDVLAEVPHDSANGNHTVRESLHRVLAIGRPNQLLEQRYDIRRPGSGAGGGGGAFEDRFWNLTHVPLFGRDGKLAFIIHAAEDVTELVRLKQASLRPGEIDAHQLSGDNERRYRFLANALPQLIWTADPNGHLDYCNDRWLAFTGLPADRIYGTAWHQLVPSR
jgi:PAS domain-containing protein